MPGAGTEVGQSADLKPRFRRQGMYIHWGAAGTEVGQSADLKLSAALRAADDAGTRAWIGIFA